VHYAKNMQFVRAHTTIPVPQPRYTHLKTWLVMEFVDGKMLLECWDSLSYMLQFRIVCTLRGYLTQLRKLTGDRPGSIVGGVVEGPLFDCEDRGPFQSEEEFRLWCEMVAVSGWTSIVRSRVRGQDWSESDIPDPPVVSGITGHWPFTFIHGDLNLSNIMLSVDGVLWIVDWASSGYYPSWLESVAMKLDDDAPISWKRWRWFVAGSDPRLDHFWDLFMQDVHRFHRRGRTV